MTAVCCHYCKNFNIRKHGFFVPKNSHQPIRRFFCNNCKRTFSSHTNWLFHRHKKPQLNNPIYKLLCSGMTQRRIASVLDISRTTVERKIVFFASWAQIALQDFFLNYKLLNPIQFDEMETFEHTKLKPLNIALAVDAKNSGPYKILSLEVGQLKPKGHLANIKKYNPRVDTSVQAIETALRNLIQFSPKNILTDDKPIYRTKIANIFNKIEHQTYSRSESAVAGENKYLFRKQFDPLFALNHTCARIRADVSRMRRRFWGTTKKIEGLKRHLVIYMAYFNGLKLKPI